MPVRENLRARGVPIDGRCPLCNAAPETTMHLFCSSAIVIQLWSALGVVTGGFLLDLMDSYMGTAATVSAELVAACTWTIWTIQNDVVWNAKSSNVEAMKRMTISFVDSMQQVFSITRSLPLVAGVSASVWSLPPQGMLTCNVDAAILTDTLPRLKVLKLSGGSCLGKQWELPEDDKFCQLIVLKIGSTDLKDWKVTGDHFPKLEHLSLSYFSKLKEIPSGFAEISNLKSIQLAYCRRSMVASVEKIKEEQLDYLKNIVDVVVISESESDEALFDEIELCQKSRRKKA
nr:disease resistance protein RPP13-like isoform X6 [Ipomoea batatas]